MSRASERRTYERAKKEGFFHGYYKMPRSIPKRFHPESFNGRAWLSEYDRGATARKEIEAEDQAANAKQDHSYDNSH
ncbi:hypothetical protein [Azospirillum sp. B4]|uniref:hypothetical protein n=1 Tax=Azospirillum sp. B4 TaxID=95605 RepID=UPI0011DE3A91|nr:hypothetical protein [Azospirillum sp. B4]